jgi:hypothetical protein
MNPGTPEINDGIDQNCINDAPVLTINTGTITPLNEDTT